MKRVLAVIGIMVLLSGGYLMYGPEYFFSRTKEGTYNVRCFSGSTSDFPMEPNEWIESFRLSGSCEQARAQAFNLKLNPPKSR